MLRRKRSPSPFHFSKHVRRNYRIDFQRCEITYKATSGKWMQLCSFREVESYNLVIHHRDAEVIKKWPFRLDLQILRHPTLVLSEASIYFDNKEKCDRWLAALDWIIENTALSIKKQVLLSPLDENY